MLVAPCLLVSVTKYVYVVLFLTLLSVDVGEGGVPVSVLIDENELMFVSTDESVGKEPTARQMSYLRT